MVQGCWLVLTQLLLQALWTSRGPDGGLRVAPSHGSLTRGDRAYGSGAGRPGTASWNGAACSGYRSRWASGIGADQAAAAPWRPTDVSSLGSIDMRGDWELNDLTTVEESFQQGDLRDGLGLLKWVQSFYDLTSDSGQIMSERV